MVWVGLDLHKRYITACALDDRGRTVAEHRRLPPDVAALVAGLHLRPLRPSVDATRRKWST